MILETQLVIKKGIHMNNRSTNLAHPVYIHIISAARTPSHKKNIGTSGVFRTRPVRRGAPWGGDRLGWGHIRQTIQSRDRQYKAPND